VCVKADEGTRSVFMPWASADSHGTDTFFFDARLKICRQHTSVSDRTRTKASRPGQILNQVG